MAEEKQHSEESPAKRRLEAAAAFVGAALALGTLAIIAWDGFTDTGGPPIIEVQTIGVHKHSGGFVLELAAINRGDAVAAQVVVEGELKRGSEIVAASETTFDYLPSHSRRRGGLFFAEDPAAFEVTLRAKGYVDP